MSSCCSSHNGIAVDLKLASRVQGLDVMLGGHTHDALPQPIVVGQTLVVNSGAHGKFLSRLDLDVQRRPRRRPPLPAPAGARPGSAGRSDMARLIDEIRAPHEATLGERLAVSESLLYRRGNFNGTFDELILDALIRRGDAADRVLARLPLGRSRSCRARRSRSRTCTRTPR